MITMLVTKHSRIFLNANGLFGLRGEDGNKVKLAGND